MVQKEKMYIPTVNFWLDTRRAKKDGSYPCKLKSFDSIPNNNLKRLLNSFMFGTALLLV